VQAGKKSFFCENHLEDNKFHLFFDELLQGGELKLLFEGGETGADLGNMEEDS
jgi:hypothetical protein